MSTELFLIIVFIVFVPLQLIMLAIFRPSHEKNIERWAKKENLKILSAEATDRDKTSFSWFTTNKSFMFYRVRVLEASGTEKSGYLCVAGQLSPLFSQKVRTEWDDANQKSPVKF